MAKTANDHCNALDTLFEFWVNKERHEIKNFIVSCFTLNLVGAWRASKNRSYIRKEIKRYAELIPEEYRKYGSDEYRRVLLEREKVIQDMENIDSSHLKVKVLDKKPNRLMLNSVYRIGGFTTNSNPVKEDIELDVDNQLTIVFQNGNPNNYGFNGITEDVLFDILQDRLQSYLRGPKGCPEISLALVKIKEAKLWFNAS